MKCMIGFDLTVQMTGGRGIDCLGCRVDDNNTVDFCNSCDILHNEMGLLFSK